MFHDDRQSSKEPSHYVNIASKHSNYDKSRSASSHYTVPQPPSPTRSQYSISSSSSADFAPYPGHSPTHHQPSYSPRHTQQSLKMDSTHAHANYPVAASSRLMLSTPAQPRYTGVVQSHHTRHQGAATSPHLSGKASYDPGAATSKPLEKKTQQDEVDELTDLLLQNMNAARDPNFFGMCDKCKKPIIGEETGCSAINQVFHVSCFTCSSCNICLSGISFFSAESSPYCEKCYMNSLEKCARCTKPITGRLLRGSGRAFHPECFICVVCKKSMDKVPFTVDAKNEIHCIEDFHRKFAPRCCVCDEPILPEPDNIESVRIVALDRSFHVSCYKCEDCGMQLRSESEGRGCYPLDDAILCKSCNARRIQRITTAPTTEL